MLDTEQAVRTRYSAAASEREAALCCPVDYDARYLKVIPQEVIDRDYGCGDPSKYVQEGETVLDLGSGGGKICFIAAQVVGPTGRVIGVDMNDTMLELARQSGPKVARAIGYDNVVFRKGKIQDLAVDRDAVDGFLRQSPVTDEAGLQALESFIATMRKETPMIADNSVDVVVSNCVLNLVDSGEKEKLFQEIFRVLRPGGRAVISDIVSDQFVPIEMQNDADLWSGCISGAFEEHDFLMAFERAGFYGIEMPVLQSEPWQTVEQIEFRSATVIAYKPEPADSPSDPDEYLGDAVIYRGPFTSVQDDVGNLLERGKRTDVTRSDLKRLTKPPYQQSIIGVMAGADVSQRDALEPADNPPSPKKAASMTIIGDDCCGTEGCC